MLSFVSTNHRLSLNTRREPALARHLSTSQHQHHTYSDSRETIIGLASLAMSESREQYHAFWRREDDPLCLWGDGSAERPGKYRTCEDSQSVSFLEVCVVRLRYSDLQQSRRCFLCLVYRRRVFYFLVVSYIQFSLIPFFLIKSMTSQSYSASLIFIHLPHGIRKGSTKVPNNVVCEASSA